jgi:uncharacterized protein (TIGR02646 family)
MQYIPKQNTEPTNWNNWFTKGTGHRSFDYGADYSSLTNLNQAKNHLLEEQHHLCAYCQQKLTSETASIEHVIPKEFNKELSTNYHNLVAVCKDSPKDTLNNRKHCDKERGNKLLPSFIFYSNSEVTNTKNNPFFKAYADGKILPKDNILPEDKAQADAFINLLNLNHTQLIDRRAKDFLNGLINAYQSLPSHQQNNKFWKVQFDRILLNKTQPFRQFLLIYIGTKIGIN